MVNLAAQAFKNARETERNKARERDRERDKRERSAEVKMEHEEERIMKFRKEKVRETVSKRIVEFHTQ